MLPSDEKPVQILNKLILTNNNRIEGYEYASRETEVEVLKDLFSRLAETSEICSRELIDEVYKLGGKPSEGVHQTGEIKEVWGKLKETLIYGDHLELLKSCDKEEEAVLEAYKGLMVIGETDFNMQQFLMFHRHYDLLEDDHWKVKNLLRVLLRAC